MKLAIAALALAVLNAFSLAAVANHVSDPEGKGPETIMLSPEECGQYGVEAANRIRKAKGEELETLPVITAEVIATVDYVEADYVKGGGDLKELDADSAQFMMTMACIGAQGDTGVPVKH